MSKKSYALKLTPHEWNVLRHLMRFSVDRQRSMHKYLLNAPDCRQITYTTVERLINLGFAAESWSRRSERFTLSITEAGKQAVMSRDTVLAAKSLTVIQKDILRICAEGIEPQLWQHFKPGSAKALAHLQSLGLVREDSDTHYMHITGEGKRLLEQ